MSRPNWTVKDENGKEHWISRSIVVIPMTIKIKGYKVYALVEKRGKIVSHTGEWCVPCGYLDWDEDMYDACVREVHEETGIKLSPSECHFVGVNSDPKESRQNVSMRFVCLCPQSAEINMNEIETKDEVERVEWLEIGQFESNGVLALGWDKINSIDSKWAFDHNHLIVNVLRDFYKGIYNVIVRM